MKTNIARTFAALNATNEAILYAKSPEELYEKVCEAAFSSGDFLATAVFLLEPDTNLLRFAAGFGEDTARLRRLDISIVADTPEGSGVCGRAYRDRKLCISNDYLNDAHSLAWRQSAAAGHVGAAAGLRRLVEIRFADLGLAVVEAKVCDRRRTHGERGLDDPVRMRLGLVGPRRWH